MSEPREMSRWNQAGIILLGATVGMVLSFAIWSVAYRLLTGGWAGQGVTP